MPNFNTKGLAPTNTARYPMPEITVDGQEGVPTLIVRSTGPTNDAYRKALAKVALRASGDRRGPLTPDAAVERSKSDRKQFRSLFPGLVIVGWENVFEDDGGKPKAVPYSESACAELLAAPDDPRPGIPDDMFDALLVFCGDPSNFREGLDAGAVAKH
jgi:hypothetical protein